jgi:hypothetical protein
MPITCNPPAPHEQEIERLHAGLPDYARTAKCVVTELTEDQWQAKYGGTSFSDNAGSSGVNGGIDIRSRRYSADLMAHEIAHQVEYQLPPAKRSDWDADWTRLRSKMPTDYAKRDSGEGFAVVGEYVWGFETGRLNADVRAAWLSAVGEPVEPPRPTSPPKPTRPPRPPLLRPPRP